MKRLFGSLLAAAMLLSVMTGAAIAARGGVSGSSDPQVALCQYIQKDGTYRAYSVGAPSVPSHLKQGDVYADAYGNCP
jgi:hypothetical protein